jgi:hypothetical protein
VPGSEYVVDVKSSARRANGAVGTFVRDEGSRRGFESRAAADEWAASLSSDGGHVWVRDANPDDAADVDGYLMAYGRDPVPEETDQPGDQGGLELFGVELLVDAHDTEQVPLERFDLK